MTDEKTCKTCRFRLRDRCRRFPPIYAGDDSEGASVYDFPETFSTHWCGEHQPIIEAKQP